MAFHLAQLNVARPHQLAGTIPGLDEAAERLHRLRADGPTEQAFTLNRRFPQPSADAWNASMSARNTSG